MLVLSYICCVKRIASIGLILLMSLQCFYKLGVITYFQLNRDYIADVLCVNREKPITMCYGQCFLEKKLDLADDNDSDDGTLPIGKQRGDLPNFLITEHNYSFQEVIQLERSNSRYLLSTSSAHYQAPFHPPALLS
jgi:hypothetical protein